MATRRRPPDTARKITRQLRPRLPGGGSGCWIGAHVCKTDGRGWGQRRAAPPPERKRRRPTHTRPKHARALGRPAEAMSTTRTCSSNVVLGWRREGAPPLAVRQVGRSAQAVAQRARRAAPQRRPALPPPAQSMLHAQQGSRQASCKATSSAAPPWSSAAAAAAPRASAPASHRAKAATPAPRATCAPWLRCCGGSEKGRRGAAAVAPAAGGAAAARQRQT